ncbi:hypothetical protein WEI85_48475 [Actinomycetes bacterium KLBMP 9797]
MRVSSTEVPGTTPLTLALGPCLVAYGVWIGGHMIRHRASAPALAWYESAPAVRVRRAALVGVGGLLVAGLFWAANSFAWAFGLGRAYDDAVRLPDRPEVVIDTRERLTDPPPGVRETPITGAAPAEYQYRYQGLRLLLEADGRLYLVPAQWTGQSRTLVLPVRRRSAASARPVKDRQELHHTGALRLSACFRRQNNEPLVGEPHHRMRMRCSAVWSSLCVLACASIESSERGAACQVSHGLNGQYFSNMKANARFLSAYRAAPSLRWGYPLEQALGHSLNNIPSLPGRTLVLVDTSGLVSTGDGQ